MTSITIRNIDPDLNLKLRLKAAEHGCTLEEEVHATLIEKYSTPSVPTSNELHPFYRIRALVEKFGGTDDLELPPREIAPDRNIFEV